MDFNQLLNTFILVNFKNDSNNANNFYQLVIITIILYLIKNYFFLVQSTKILVDKYFQKKSSITLSMKLQSLSTTIRTHFVPSNKVLSVLYELKNTKLSVSSYEEIHTSFDENDDDKNWYGKTELIPLLKNYRIKDDLYITISIDIEKITSHKQSINDEKLSPCEYKVITIQLYSYDHSIDYIQDYLDYIQDYLDKCEKQYNSYKSRDDNVLKIFTTGITTDDETGNNIVKFNKYNFNSNKTFVNSFFEGKEQIIDRIDKYISNLENYKRLGIPHSLGFLFYGEAGCSKTSTIKAIANYTNRSIISVNMKHVSSVEDLIKLFNNPNILYNNVLPLSKRMYVFEEIDCYDCFLTRNFVNTQEQKDETNISDILTDVLSATQNKKIKPKDKDKNNQITLGQILEVLDGVIECEDRLCIFTTNHVNKIDKALLRPGRIDMIVEFKKLRKCDIQNLFKLWFNKDIPEKDLKNIKDYCITQAEFGKLCFENLNNPNKLISVLSKL